MTPDARARRAPWIAAAAAYALGAVTFTWPLAADLAGGVWGDRFDAWTTMWLIWHLGDALFSGELASVTDRIFFPVGYNLWSFGHLALQLAGAPLIALGVSAAATYNLLLIGAFTATGLAGHALGRRLAGSHWGGLLAGSLFAWNPYLYGEMSAGCVELVAAWFFPLQALLLLRLFDRPGWARALPVCGLLAVTGPFNWYYTVFTGMFIVAMGTWRLAAGGSNRWSALGWLAAAVGAAGLSNLPLIPLVRRETPERGGIAAETFSAEGWDLSYQVTNGKIPLEQLTEVMLERNDAMQVAINSTSLSNLLAADFVANPLESTPGALAWSFGLLGLIAAGRRARGWAAIAAGFSILTLGPFLLIDATPPIPDWSLERPLPYYYFYNEVPFFSKAYRPYRLGVVTLLALSALAALGLGRLRPRLRSPVAAAAFALAASQPHWAGERPAARPLADAEVPAVYEELRDAPEGAVIELPLQYQPLSVANARFQYYQVVHHKPLLNCNQLIRRTELLQFRDFVAANGFLQVALDISRREPPYGWTSDDTNQLREMGFRYVVMHRAFTPSELHLSGYQGAADRVRQPAIDLLRESLGAPIIDADDVWIFEIPEHPPGRRFARGADDFLEVRVPWTDLRLPLRLRPGDGGVPLALPADARPARFSLWTRRLAGEGELALVIDGPRGAWSGPLPTEVGPWAFSEVDLPPIPPGGSARLVAEGGPLDLELDALQFDLGRRR